MKKIAILGTVAVLFGCSSATVADDHRPSKLIQYEKAISNNVLDQIIATHKAKTLLEKQAEEARSLRIAAAEHAKALRKNKIAINSRIQELQNNLGKTPYIFSGSTPGGWDCSGLVRWFYLGLNHELPHSANKQGLLKPKVTNPLPGDIVVFRYKTSESFIHSGIYIGNNEIIHAGFGSGDRTEIIGLDDVAFTSQDYYFVRIMETE